MKWLHADKSKYFILFVAGLLLTNIWTLSVNTSLKRDTTSLRAALKGYKAAWRLEQRKVEELVSQLAQEKDTTSRLRIQVSRHETATREISYLLRGSPLEPYASVFVLAEQQTGVSAKLLVAIAGVESSFGRRCRSFNPFGILKRGEGTGLRIYASWEDGIYQAARFIRKRWGAARSPYQLKGYCTNPAWAGHVERIMRRGN